MQRNQKVSVGGATLPLLLLLNAIVLEEGWVANKSWYWLLALTMPLLITAIIFNRKAS